MKLQFALSGVIIFLLSACAGPKVLETEKAEDANLASYKTFDFYRLDANGDTATRQYNETVGKLQNAIALELQKFGFLMTKTDPDLLVNVGLVVEEKDQTRQTDFRTDAPKYSGQRRYSWKSEEVKIGSYKVGTMTIDLVDRKQNKMVWTGTVQNILPNKPSKTDASIKAGVKELFDKFPLPKKN